MKLHRRSKTVIIVLPILVLILLVFPRTPVVRALTVSGNGSFTPQLVVVMGGGFRPDGGLGRSTRERLDALVDLLPQLADSCSILVSEYPGGRARMEEYLASKGVPEDRLLQSSYPFEEDISGTVQNVRDLLSVLVEQPEYNRVLIITSPYHQRRVMLILHQHLDAHSLDRNVQFMFHQLGTDSEVYTCGRFRFLRLVGRELAGIVIQRVFGHSTL